MPDIAAFAWDQIPVNADSEVENVFRTWPDWTIFFQKRYANEILSPEQRPTKVIGNILHCLNHGCQMGWLIDPEERSLLIYPSGQQPELLEAELDRLPVPELMADLQLTVGDLFGWMKL